MGKLRVLFIAFLMLIGCCCLSGCGKHAMTEKEMETLRQSVDFSRGLAISSKVLFYLS